MKIHEYQGKEILRQFGVPVPRGIAAFTVQEAVEAAQKLGGLSFLQFLSCLPCPCFYHPKKQQEHQQYQPSPYYGYTLQTYHAIPISQENF